MMSLSYGLDHAKRWAAFSGDYNPIHFDLAEARRLGMAGLCVHGMRALLDVKSALSAALEKSAPSSEGLMFSSRLREPVMCGMPYQLAVKALSRQEQTQVKGDLLHFQTQQISISSKLARAQSLAFSPPAAVKTLGEEALTALHAKFLALGDHGAPPWSFLDAVLFRLLINAPATLETVQTIIPEYEATSLPDVFSLVQVVQTHHETHFSPQLLRQNGQRFTPLDYAILPTLVMGDKNVGLVLVAGIQAWRVSEPLMSVTVTLKTGPLAAQKIECRRTPLKNIQQSELKE